MDDTECKFNVNSFKMVYVVNSESYLYKRHALTRARQVCRSGLGQPVTARYLRLCGTIIYVSHWNAPMTEIISLNIIVVVGLFVSMTRSRTRRWRYVSTRLSAHGTTSGPTRTSPPRITTISTTGSPAKVSTFSRFFESDVRLHSHIIALGCSSPIWFYKRTWWNWSCFFTAGYGPTVSSSIDHISVACDVTKVFVCLQWRVGWRRARRSASRSTLPTRRRITPTTSTVWSTVISRRHRPCSKCTCTLLALSSRFDGTCRVRMRNYYKTGHMGMRIVSFMRCDDVYSRHVVIWTVYM